MALVLNGDGNVTGLTPGGLPDASITQADLAINTAGNGPIFSVYLAGTRQTISSNTWTKIAVNTEEYDSANAFDSSTNYRFQPTVAGYYIITAGSFTNATLYGFTTGTAIYKNGGQYKCTYLNFAGSSTPSPWNQGTTTVSAIVYLNGTTDYVELYAYGAYATGATVYIETGGANTFLQGSLLRAA